MSNGPWGISMKKLGGQMLGCRWTKLLPYLPWETRLARTARVRMQTCGHRLIFTGLCPLAGDRSHVLYSYLLQKLFIVAPQCCRVCRVWRRWSTQILTALLFSHLAFISSFIWNYKYLAHHKTLYTMEIQEYCIFMWLHYYGNVRCEDLVSTLQYVSSRSYWHHTSCGLHPVVICNPPSSDSIRLYLYASQSRFHRTGKIMLSGFL